jgi:hypothetical protein
VVTRTLNESRFSERRCTRRPWLVSAQLFIKSMFTQSAEADDLVQLLDWEPNHLVQEVESAG